MNHSPSRLGTRLVRAGIRLFIFGLVMSFGMIGHYLVGSRYPNGAAFLENIQVWFACPWTLSTAVVLLGSVGMIAIGTAYAALGHTAPTYNPRSSEIAALHLCIWSLVLIFVTGYVGYFVVDAVAPGYYYIPIKSPKNVWLFAQLGCVIAYMIGVCLLSGGIKRLGQPAA